MMQRSASPQWKLSMLSRIQQQQQHQSSSSPLAGGENGDAAAVDVDHVNDTTRRNETDLLLPRDRKDDAAAAADIGNRRRGGARGSIVFLFTLGLCSLLFLLAIKGYRHKEIWTDLNQQGANLVSLVSRFGEAWHRKRQEDNEDEEEDVLLSSSSSLLHLLARNLEAHFAIGIISGSGPKQQNRIKIAKETWVTSLDTEHDGMLVFSDVTNVTIPTIGLSGTDATWQGAQARWLPALAHLYLSFPSADWFILGDDDTFLSPSHLKAMLAKYDANKVWYIGRAMFVEPQRGPLAEGKAKGSLTAFAHGGSAMALSSGLMKAFDPHLEEALDTGICTGASGYGDGDLGLCLDHYLGITVTHEACFHSSGPEHFRNMSDGFMAQVDEPCSFHYAFREGEGEGEEKDGKDDGVQMWKWHRVYNLGKEEEEGSSH